MLSNISSSRRLMASRSSEVIPLRAAVSVHPIYSPYKVDSVVSKLMFWVNQSLGSQLRSHPSRITFGVNRVAN